jgi:hypothetical protein
MEMMVFGGLKGEIYLEMELKHVDDADQVRKNVAKWEGLDPSCIIYYVK